MFVSREGQIWLGSAPGSQGSGILVTADGLISWRDGSQGDLYVWSELGDVQVLVAESRLRFPRLLSWLAGLVLVSLALWSPREPEEIHIHTASGVPTGALTAVASEPYGYLSDHIAQADSVLRRLAEDPASRNALNDADTFVASLRKTSR